MWSWCSCWTISALVTTTQTTHELARGRTVSVHRSRLGARSPDTLRFEGGLGPVLLFPQSGVNGEDGCQWSGGISCCSSVLSPAVAQNQSLLEFSDTSCQRTPESSGLLCLLWTPLSPLSSVSSVLCLLWTPAVSSVSAVLSCQRTPDSSGLICPLLCLLCLLCPLSPLDSSVSSVSSGLLCLLCLLWTPLSPLDSSVSSGLLCLLWTPLSPPDSFVSSRLLCLLRTPLSPLDSSVSSGLLCLLWTPLSPLDSSVSSGLLCLL